MFSSEISSLRRPIWEGRFWLLVESKPGEWKQAGKLCGGLLGRGEGGARGEFLWVREGGSWLGSRACVRGMFLFRPGRSTTRGAGRWRAREGCFIFRRAEGT